MTDLNGAERLMSALRQVSTAEQRHAKAISRRLSMNASDLNALSFVVDKGSPTTGDVGRQLDLSSGAVTGVIDRLMKRGFVERVSDPRDRRKVAVRAVAAMIAPISELFKPIESGMAELLARYSEQQIVTIAQFLEQAAELVLARAESLERGKAS
jgi:DNA-binding MarR family transcriptional regulator